MCCHNHKVKYTDVGQCSTCIAFYTVLYKCIHWVPVTSWTWLLVFCTQELELSWSRLYAIPTLYMVLAMASWSKSFPICNHSEKNSVLLSSQNYGIFHELLLLNWTLQFFISTGHQVQSKLESCWAKVNGVLEMYVHMQSIIFRVNHYKL